MQAGLGLGSGQDAVAGLLEVLAHQAQDIGLVVDHQNGFHGSP